MQRRKFITLIGGAAVPMTGAIQYEDIPPLEWRAVARAQRAATRPPPAVCARLLKIAVAMSAIGTYRTFRRQLRMSAFGGKADMPFCTANVC
jgi:hypothetical protein